MRKSDDARKLDASARQVKEEYPSIARQARREKAVIDWGDEMGLGSDHVSGASFAPMGETARDPGGQTAFRLQHDLGDHQQRGAFLHGVSGQVQAGGLR